MCFPQLQKLFFLICVFFLHELKCDCRSSYLTFCDDLNDLSHYDVENWRELVIGRENTHRSLHSLDYNILSIHKFQKLQILVIVGQVNDIKTNTFKIEPDLTKLEFLKFYGNTIRILKFNTFVDIRLRTLSLVNNDIEYIQKEAFDYCDIHSIDLSHNKLERIETDVFTEDFLRNKTKEIVLRHNAIHHIDAKSFPSSLEILNLDHNRIEFFSIEAFANLYDLQELTLSHNRIFRVADSIPFGELTELQILDLSHNQINSSEFFNSFKSPQREPQLQISLAFNKLQFLVLKDDSLKRYIVSLYGNPWDCQCWSTLAKFMESNMVKRNVCDLKLFSGGQVPYCVDYGYGDCAKTVENLSKKPNVDYRNFLEAIKRREDTVGCKLTPKRV